LSAETTDFIVVYFGELGGKGEADPEEVVFAVIGVLATTEVVQLVPVVVLQAELLPEEVTGSGVFVVEDADATAGFGF
jgi:hypothetical protein